MSLPHVYMVSRNRSVIHPSGKLIKALSIFPTDGVAERKIHSLVKSGAIVRADGGEAPPVEQPLTLTTAKSQNAVGAEQERPEFVAPKKEARQFKPHPKWNRDPKKLVGKSLSELNVMIKEIDPDEDVFTVESEAAAFLSQSFTG